MPDITDKPYDIKAIAAQKLAIKNSKPYRGDAELSTHAYCALSHHEQMAVDRRIDAGHGLQQQSQRGSGEGQRYVVGYRAGQSGNPTQHGPTR